ncbi:unnamed protein product [Moneuplotes crassus]|uniref:Uncharacterized protein n=1 Tax=Euplotes crassus TaxID=5936 RepID=A0AAD2D959_EUPCR|nr:unnamed protein product [Moneuplotes crassus]
MLYISCSTFRVSGLIILFQPHLIFNQNLQCSMNFSDENRHIITKQHGLSNVRVFTLPSLILKLSIVMSDKGSNNSE